MRRKVVFLTMVAVGLVQMAPVSAQVQESQSDQDAAPAAAARLPDAPAAAPVPAEVRDRARELAEKDLAAAPPEEMKPVLVDPGDPRPAIARARQAAAEARAREAARAAVAEAEAPSRPVPASPDRESRPLLAADDRESGDDGIGAEDRDASRAVYADRAAEAPAEDAEAPVGRDLRGRQARLADADREADARAEPLPGRDLRGRQAREIYADDAPVAPQRTIEPSMPRSVPAPAARPVYAGDDRDADAAYPDARRAPDGDIYEPLPRERERYAIVDRDLRPDAARDDGAGQQWGRRAADPACDADRAGRLRDDVRRKADFERIDGRAAEDIEDEIGHAANLQRSYCASGMNDWREQRLDRLYAQIEDRIRYEEDRRWRR